MPELGWRRYVGKRFTIPVATFAQKLPSGNGYNMLSRSCSGMCVPCSLGNCR
jgi:hypothetical protein